MKEAATNSFNGGLVMDMNELNTPNTVLTNCLNGTFITYNGNEMALQNDMGNAKVGTSYLAPGYVPVGMKEYGGIIYVASYNPKTGKSQLGSFPSPQQIYSSEDNNIAELKINFSLFFNDSLKVKDESYSDVEVPVINREYYDIGIFQNKSDDSFKIFHPGDKFIITSKTIDANIIKAINENILQFKLAVVNESGSLEYIDNSKLRFYGNGLWIYESESDTTDLIKNSPELVQVYAGKSSGRLMFIVEFNLLESFNLYRKYEVNNDKYSVTFTGKSVSKKGDEYSLMCSSESIGDKIKITEENQKINYDIYPVYPNYGAVERLKKTGTIDIKSLRENKDSFGSWNVTVSDYYATIDWTYDFFDLNNKEIEKMRFVFFRFDSDLIYPLTASIDALTASIDALTASTGDYNIEIIEPVFNGDFETIIPFSSDFKKNYVYICRVDKKYIGETDWINGIDWELTYTGTYLNEANTSSSVYIPIDDNYTTKTNLNQSNLYKNTGWEEGGTLTKFTTNSAPTDFIVAYPDDNKDYSFTTIKRNNYTIEVYPDVSFNTKYEANNKTYGQSAFAGNPDSAYLRGFIKTVDNVKQSATPKYTSNDSSLISHLANIDEQQVNTPDYANGKLTYDVSISRGIYANSGSVTNKQMSVERLCPIYEESDKNKLCSFKESSGILTCTVGDRDTTYYNSKVILGDHTTQGENRGIDAGYSADNNGISGAMKLMGGQPIGIFGGCDGQDASLRITPTQGLVYDIRGNYFWNTNQTNEIDNSDNFLFASCKCTDGQHRLINLASRKDENLFTDNGNKRESLPFMLRAILSQLLIAKRMTMTYPYCGPDRNNYIYHLPYDTELTFTFEVNDSEEIPFYLDSKRYSISELKEMWNDVLTDLGAKSRVNLDRLPVFKAKPKTYTATVKLGSDIKIDDSPNILNYYLNAYSFPDYVNGISNYGVQLSDILNKSGIGYKFTSTDTINEQYLRKYIFVGEVESINSNGVCTLALNEDGSPKVKSIAGSNALDATITYYNVLSGGYHTDTLSPLEICNINKIFTTSLSYDGMFNSSILDGYYNELLLDSFDVVDKSTWVEKGDRTGPDICYLAHFGDLSAIKHGSIT